MYGLSDQKDVKEDHPLSLLLYIISIKECANLFYLNILIIISGGILGQQQFGYAPRLRLDLSVNILSNHAINKNKITVFGGEQLRPNLHIQDYCNLVELLITTESEKIKNEIFNVGYQNLSINQIAQIVKNVVQEEFPEKY